MVYRPVNKIMVKIMKNAGIIIPDTTTVSVKISDSEIFCPDIKDMGQLNNNILDIGKPKEVTSQSSKVQPKKNKKVMFSSVDEIVYGFINNQKCYLKPNNPVASSSTKIIICKRMNSNLFEISSAGDHSRLAYCYYGYLKMGTDNPFHEPDFFKYPKKWAQLIVTTVTSHDQKRLSNLRDFSITRKELTKFVLPIVSNWVEEIKLKYFKTHKEYQIIRKKSFSVAEEFTFIDDIELDMVDNGFRWVKAKKEDRMWSFNPRDTNGIPVNDLNYNDCYGYAIIKKDKNGVRGFWYTFENPNTKEKVDLPITRKQMERLTRIQVYNIIINSKQNNN